MLKKLENQVTFFTSNQINEKCFKNELESLCGQKKFNDINQKELAIISKKKFKELLTLHVFHNICQSCLWWSIMSQFFINCRTTTLDHDNDIPYNMFMFVLVTELYYCTNREFSGACIRHVLLQFWYRQFLSQPEKWPII